MVTILLIVNVAAYIVVGFDESKLWSNILNTRWLYDILVLFMALIYQLFLVIVDIIFIKNPIDDITLLFETIVALMFITAGSSVSFIVEIALSPVTLVVYLLNNTDITNSYSSLKNLLINNIRGSFGSQFIDEIKQRLSERAGFDIFDWGIDSTLSSVIDIAAISSAAKGGSGSTNPANDKSPNKTEVSN